MLCCCGVSPLLLFWSFSGQPEEVVLARNCQFILCCFQVDVLLAADCCLIISIEVGSFLLLKYDTKASCADLGIRLD